MKNTFPISLILFSLLLAPTGSSRAEPQSSVSSYTPPPAPAWLEDLRGTCLGCNVLVVTFDSLRADALACYGGKRDAAPGLCALAKQGILFEQAHSAASWTFPSLLTMATGNVSSHAMTAWVVPSKDDIAKDNIPSTFEIKEQISELFQGYGYTTAFLTDHPGLHNYSIFRGVEYAVVVEHSTPRCVFAKASELIESNSSKPIFSWLHAFDPHYPYEPDPFWADYAGYAPDRCNRITNKSNPRKMIPPPDSIETICLRQLYEAEMMNADDAVASLILPLLSKNRDQWLIVLSADHGEEFKEHGGFGHMRTVYEELIRVPLILVGGDIPSGLQIAEPISLANLPLLLRTVVLGEEIDNWRPVVSSTFGFGTPTNPLSWIEGTRKCIFESTDKGQCFDLSNDPGELFPKSVDDKSFVSLRDNFSNWYNFREHASDNDPAPSSHGQCIDVSDEQRSATTEALRNLGYIK